MELSTNHRGQRSPLFSQEIASIESKLKNKEAELETEKEHQKKSSSGAAIDRHRSQHRDANRVDIL